MTEVSAFKQLYSEMIKNGGDWNSPKKTIKCYVKESFPHFLVTDGYFYVACYFTKKAVDEFHSKYSNLNITDLRSRVIVIQDWTLEMARVNSANVFTSYGGIECRLIVRSFKPDTQSKDNQLSLTRHPVNLYRDDEMKTLIQNYIHGCVSGAVSGGAKEQMADISRMTAKANVNQGIVSFANGNNFNSYTFKEGKNATVDLDTIFRQEKGAAALQRLRAQPAAGAGAKVKGGASKDKGGARKTSANKIGNVIRKIHQNTPGRAAQKQSTGRILTKAPTLQSPGGDNQAGTTDHATMRDFNKLIRQLKGKKGNAGKSGKASGSKLGKRSKN